MSEPKWEAHKNKLPLDTWLPAGHEAYAEPVRHSYMEAMSELLAPFPSTPIVDFPIINELLHGFRPYEFTILCGATGTGKTTLIANWSASWIKQGVPHFVASVETGRTDFIKRVVSVIANEDWNTGEPVEHGKLKKFTQQYQEVINHDALHLSLYENRFTVETLMADIAWMVKHHGIKVAIIDNLNFFLEVKRAEDSLIEMDRVIHELVMFSKNVKVHIVMLMHPKKTLSGRVESEFDIKGSSTAVQEAYNVLLFNRANPALVEEGILQKYDRELKFQKVRRKGRTMGKIVILSSSNGVKYEESKILEHEPAPRNGVDGRAGGKTMDRSPR